MDITRLLRGKRVARVATNGYMLRVTCDDNTEIDIAWVDGNGAPLKGRPMVGNYGHRLQANGVRDLMRPDLLRTVN